MKLADVSIRRPVFATMIVMSLVVMGLFSYLQLNVDLYPNVDIPFVVVTGILPGAGPEQIESDVTAKIEDAVNTVEGVDFIQSYSRESMSLVVIAFKLEVDGKQAAQDVREKIAGIRATLPEDLEDPVVQRYDPQSLPIMSLTISGDRSEKDITTFTKDVIKKRIENIPGVGNAQILGGSEREIRVEVDAARLQSYGLSIQDVNMAVGASNVEIPGGNLTEGKRQLLLRTMGKYETVEQFENIILKNSNGGTVYLKDVATVLDGVKERVTLARLNGKTAVALSIIKQSGSNTVQVAEQVKKEIENLEKQLPSDIKVTIAQDNSIFIEESINDVLFDLFYGGLLAIIVIYLFLANGRATIISALALPTSVIASFILMYALNFTLNMMTLLALSLAVGLLIDDAIVVIENIYRHLDMGETPMEAAKSASEEIGLAVMATTFTIVAVFIPIAFMKGIVGRFFYEFGLTISVAVLVSLFVAFTLTPMLSSRWLKREDEDLKHRKGIWNRGLYYFNHIFEWLSGIYGRQLRWALNHRKTIVFLSFLIFIGSFMLMGALGSEFFPQVDRSEFTLVVKAAPGSSIEQTSDIAQQIESSLRKRPEVTQVLTTIGSQNNPITRADMLVKLVKKHDRVKSDQDIIAELREEFKKYPGATMSMLMEGMGGAEKPIAFSVRGPEMSQIQKYAGMIENIMRNTPGAVEVENSLELSKPEIRLNIDRERASDLGINPFSIASTIRAMVDGYIATKYQEDDEQIDVRVLLEQGDRTNLSDINSLTIKSSKTGPQGEGYLIPVSDVANLEYSTSPSVINRYDKQKEIRVDANTQGRIMGEVLGDIQAEINKINFEPGYGAYVVGEGENQAESFRDMLLSLMLAIVFVYIVLAAQFESFVHPFSIMLALPLSIIGAALFLFIFGSTLSVMSMIGIIMLMGLVTKNGILLVDYANVLRERGLTRFEALAQAGPTRLRPILMTTFAMVFGMLPVALALGEGAEFRAPMGQAVIGGLITSTMLTLFVVPVVYEVIDDMGKSRVVVFAKKLFTRKKKVKTQTEDPVLHN